jgi:hypothetical protein
LRVIEFNGNEKVIKAILKVFAPPFAMEVAAHQIGTEIHNYLIVPMEYLNKVLRISGGKETKDYNIYHPGGVNLGYSLKIQENSTISLNSFMDIIKKLDFSKVDEIGEGAMFQLIFGENPNGNLFIGSARVLVSAPSLSGAREIVESLRKEFPGCKWVEEKDQSFIDAATYRELGPYKGMIWTTP